MACEEGEMIIRIDDGYEEAFVNCYNEYFSDTLTVDDLGGCIDIWNRFGDPYEPGLNRMSMKFAADHPDVSFSIEYEACWDCDDSKYIEVISYENRILTDFEKYRSDDDAEYKKAFLNILTEDIFKKIFKITPPDVKLCNYGNTVVYLEMNELAEGNITYEDFMSAADDLMRQAQCKSEATEEDFEKSIPAQLCALDLPCSWDFFTITKKVYKLCDGKFVECDEDEE